MKTIIKILLIALFFSLIALGLISCGARKVEKSYSKEEKTSNVIDNSVIEKQVDTNVKTTTTVKVDDKNEIVTEETIISPEDNTKEAFVIEKDGTKVVLNNVKKVYKKTIQKNNSQSQTFGNSEQVQKETSKEQKAVKKVNTYKKENSVKNVDKKAFNMLNLLWLIIPIALIYFLYRQYKKYTIL